MIAEGDLLWQPSREWIEQANLTEFMRWLRSSRNVAVQDYHGLWRWSVQNLEQFWEAIWEYFAIESSAPYTTVLASRQMPGAVWFSGARLNFAQHILKNERTGTDAVVSFSEIRGLQRTSWTQMAAEVRILATRLRQLGVGRGDRIVGYLPNIPEAVTAFLAASSIGALWSSCSPDFGVHNILDRFSQIAPKVLFCVDGYRYKGKDFDRRPELARVIGELDSLERIIHLPYLYPEETLPGGKAVLWRDLLQHPPVSAEGFEFEQVPFNHPLWILFSSGTTGLPKPIVHGHGGILLEHLKLLSLQMDLKHGDRMFYFTTTGWMVWNFLVSSMLLGAVPLLYDGNPIHPTPDALWQFISDTDAAFFGTSPTYVQMLQSAGIVPRKISRFERLRSIMLAGSPVTAETMAWFSDNVKKDLWVAAGSGGTDICSGLVGQTPILPVYAGEIQAPHLAVDVTAFNETGAPVVGEVGELVVRQPMPSMPICFWNDPDGRRYRESYFEEFPGVWRHGDFFRINHRGGCYVLGRSDATLNRYGVRIGTAEVYRCLASIPEIADALILNLDLPGGKFFMPLFVKVAPGFRLDDRVKDKICSKLRDEYSPRHVPDRIYEIDEIPYTLTGKKMEVPVLKILRGWSPEKVANRDAMANPASLDYFIRFREENL